MHREPAPAVRGRPSARPRFLVDVDELLADFQGPALEAMRTVTGRDIRREQFDVWDLFSCLSRDEMDEVVGIISEPGFCTALPAFEEAKQALASIRERFDVYAVTSPMPCRHWVYERDLWLKDHYGLDRTHIIYTSSKYMVKGDAYLDDRPDSVERWRTEHPDSLAMLWHLPNTAKLGQDDIRVYTWDQVIDRLGTLL